MEWNGICLLFPKKSGIYADILETDKFHHKCCFRIIRNNDSRKNPGSRALFLISQSYQSI